MKNLPRISDSIVMWALFAGHAHAQTFYQCKDAAGNVRFSNRACKSNTPPITVEPHPGVVTPERKAASDARIQRDSALANQVEAQRRAPRKPPRQRKASKCKAPKLSKAAWTRNAPKRRLPPPVSSRLAGPSVRHQTQRPIPRDEALLLMRLHRLCRSCEHRPSTSTRGIAQNL